MKLADVPWVKNILTVSDYYDFYSWDGHAVRLRFWHHNRTYSFHSTDDVSKETYKLNALEAQCLLIHLLRGPNDQGTDPC